MANPVGIECALSELSTATSSASSISIAESDRTVTLSEAHVVAHEIGKVIDASFYFQDAFFEVGVDIHCLAWLMIPECILISYIAGAKHHIQGP